MVDGMDEIVQEFLVESHENLDQLDRDFVALEQEPESRELLSSIFRTIHTIKGTSGFLAFNRLEAVTHVGENLLSRLRDGKMQTSPEITDVLLAMVDTVRSLLAAIEAKGEEGDEVDIDAVVDRLTAVLEGRPSASAAPAPVAEEQRPPRPSRPHRARRRQTRPTRPTTTCRTESPSCPCPSRSPLLLPQRSTTRRRRRPATPSRAAASPTAASASMSTCSTR